MTTWFAAIDMEVLIWGVLAVIYFVAQIVGQFTKKKGSEGNDGPRRSGVPAEIREFLEEIQGRGAQEIEEDDWPPPPPPIQKTVVRPPPVPKTTPQPARPTMHRKAMAASSGKIVAALEKRRLLFQQQLQRQAQRLSESQIKRASKGILSETEGQIAQPSSPAENGQAYLSAGLKGFKLPSLGLPGASTSQRERQVSNPITIPTQEALRAALIHTIILGPPVSANPPGCGELTKSK